MATPMRIGFGATIWARGIVKGYLDGIGVYTLNLWRNLPRHGVELRAAVFGDFGDVSTKAPDFPRQALRFEHGYKTYAARSVLTGLPFPFPGKAGDIDIFHAPDHYIPKLRRVPVVATIMDAIPFARPQWGSPRLQRLKNRMFRREAAWADHVITISEFSKKEIVEHFGIEAGRITVIPPGVNESFFNRMPDEERAGILSRLGLKPGFFITVGTLQPRKNIGRIIEAHRSLDRELRRAHPLIIVGNYGWRAEDLRADLKRLEDEGLGRWLRGIGHDELLALLQSASALVYPSLYEGFGLPIIEGFASAVPVITSNTTSIPEAAGNAALLVNPESIEEIARAMGRVVSDDRLRDSLIEKGTVRARSFSWERCARETVEVYRKLV